MTTKMGTFRSLAAAAALLATAGLTAAAETPDRTHEIRVLNHYAGAVEVYLEDGHGKLHALGRVAGSELKFLQVDDEITDRGAFRLKIFPEARMGTMVDASSGIRSVALELGEDDSVNVWLGAELARSQIEVTKG